jgi:hypothetical protein
MSVIFLSRCFAGLHSDNGLCAAACLSHLRHDFLLYSLYDLQCLFSLRPFSRALRRFRGPEVDH